MSVENSTSDLASSAEIEKPEKMDKDTALVISDIKKMSADEDLHTNLSTTISSSLNSKSSISNRVEDTNFSQKFRELSSRQFHTLLSLALVDFCTGVLLANQSPWFPLQTKEIGLSVGYTGVVFGAFEMAFLVSFPIFQSKMSKKISSQTLFQLGVLFTATCSIIFAFLGLVTNSTIFLICSTTLRAIEGVSQAAFHSASFSIVAQEFPESVPSTFVSLETFYGLGILVGPVLGGALWDTFSGSERFILTFSVLGTALFLIGLLTLYTLPTVSLSMDSELKSYLSSGFRSFSLLNVPNVTLCMFSLLTGSLSLGFLYVTLSRHLAEFNIHPILLGGIFMVNGGVGGLSAPLFGKIIDRTRRSKLVLVLGALLTIGGFLLIGPPTFIPLKKSALYIAIGLFLHGLGLAATFAASFKFMIHQSIKYGYANNIKTYWLSISLWTFAFSFGSLIGTVASGFLYDALGFNSASWLVLDFNIIVIFLVLFSIISDGIAKSMSTPKKTSSLTKWETESEPLLASFSQHHAKSRPSLKKNYSDTVLSDKNSGSPRSYGGLERKSQSGSAIKNYNQ